MKQTESRGLLGLLLLGLSCQSPGLEPGARTAPASAFSQTAALSEPALASAAFSDAAFVAELRKGSWGSAAKLFDADYPHPVEPALRYVRARIALQLGDPERACDLLNGLAALLPTLGNEARALQAEAELKLGRTREALSYYAQQSAAEARLKAAEASRKLGETDSARRLIDTLLAEKSLSTSLKVAALSERFELALKAASDAKLAGSASRTAPRELLQLDGVLRQTLASLLVDFATSELVVQNEKQWRAAVPEFQLSKEQHFKRAERFSDAGNYSRFEQELAALGRAPGPALAPLRLKRASAWALYKSRTDYARAAQLFDECARLDSSPDHDAYYAARAWSRANEDEKAFSAYGVLVQRYPKSKYAELARYQRARLHFLHARFSDAVRAYDVFLKTSGKRVSDEKRQGRYERAVALLAAAESVRAKAEWKDLVADAEPRLQSWYRHLWALSLSQTGETALAVPEFTRVIQDAPLSFAALASAARLKALGQSVPAVIAPKEAVEEQPKLSVALPERVALLENLGLSSDAEAALAEESERILKQQAPRGGEALCQTFGLLSAAGRRFRHAQNLLGPQALNRAPGERSLWAWHCNYPTPYQAWVTPLENSLGLPSFVLYSVMRQESAFLVNARSPVGAVGLMQLMPKTAANVEQRLLASAAGPVAGTPSPDAASDLTWTESPLTAPYRNVTLGANYLARLLPHFGGNVALAVAAYNAGPAAVDRWLARGSALPLDLFVAFIGYAETRDYVQRVLGNWARYSYLFGGESSVPELSLSLPSPKAQEHDLE